MYSENIWLDVHGDAYPYHIIFSRSELEMKTGKNIVKQGMWSESNKEITLATNNCLDIGQE